MEKPSFFTILLVLVFNFIYGQEIILTFIPANDTLTIDSIQATNLVTNESLTVAGGESVNLNDITTGASEFELISDNSSIYPNPFQNYTTLQYTTTKKETVKLRMINSSGATVATFNKNLLSGTNQFKITTKSPGIYFINIQTGEKNISHKLVSLTKGGQDRIELSSANGETVTNKSSKMIQSEQVIHFRLYSGDNITIIADSPTESKTYEVEFYECKDADDQNYPVVHIGEQWWMAKNLATDKGESSWSEVYENNVAVFGRLYNWETALTACPEHWHLPTYEEWQQLAQFISDNLGINYLPDEWQKAGIHLKATIGWINNGNGLDDYGFSALPGGFAIPNGFAGINQVGNWWSSKEASLTEAWNLILSESHGQLVPAKNSKEYGFSIRCIKDN